MHYICIHGVCHGGWCWEKVEERLVAAGHTVSCPDLPLTSFADDVQAVRNLLEQSPEPVVLVGHSYGGHVISAAAKGQGQVKHLVYVAALMLAAKEVPLEASAEYPSDFGEYVRIHDDGYFDFADEDSKRCFYNQCDAKDAEAAVARLRSTALECVSVPSGCEPWETTPSTYLLCSDDRAVSPDQQRVMAQRAQHVIELDTDHSPFYSALEETCDCLLALE